MKIPCNRPVEFLNVGDKLVSHYIRFRLTWCCHKLAVSDRTNDVAQITGVDQDENGHLNQITGPPLDIVVVRWRRQSQTAVEQGRMPRFEIEFGHGFTRDRQGGALSL